MEKKLLLLEDDFMSIAFALETEEREYSILPVMSELSTVRCDRALGLWIAGTRAADQANSSEHVRPSSQVH